MNHDGPHAGSSLLSPAVYNPCKWVSREHGIYINILHQSLDNVIRVRCCHADFKQLHGILDVIILCILIAQSETRAHEVACTKIASVEDLGNCFGLVSLTLDWLEYPLNS